MQESLVDIPYEGCVMSPKMATLAELCAATPGPGLVFVERKSLCIPIKHLLDKEGVRSLAVMGVQAMSDEARSRALQAFAQHTVDVLVTTPSLEEGIDVEICRFVVRFDYFPTVRSHIQGSGRVRAKDAKIYYFEQDPVTEIAKADIMVRTAKGEATEQEERGNEAEGLSDGEENLELLGPHQWGEEDTMWDVIQNKSYRGCVCQKCGARVKIVAVRFGKGRKKLKRAHFLVQGKTSCA